jgi:hypothetical protein
MEENKRLYPISEEVFNRKVWTLPHSVDTVKRLTLS